MDDHSSALWTEFPFAESEKNKGASEKAIQYVMTLICALLNSGGGILHLYSTSDEVFSVDKMVKKFEQKLKDLFGSYGCCTLFKLVSAVDNRKVVFKVESLPRLCTLNYHLYLPSEAQINLILANEPIENIQVILDPETKINGQLIKLGSHQKDFTINEHIRSRETKTEQFKLLKQEPTKHVSIADRIVGKSAKFKQTVSAFANYMGGHIYYGVKDNGEVKGEQLQTDTIRYSIVKKVQNAIQKMIWPTSPTRGMQWEIYFESVRQHNGQIPGLFVIIVTVVRCPGGVFEQAPESYSLINNEASLTPFETWRKRLRMSGNGRCRDGLNVEVRACPGRPQSNQLHVNIRKQLARFRNNGDTQGFTVAADKIMEKHPGDDIQIIVRQQQAACAYRLNNFRDMLILLSENTVLLNSTESSQPSRLLLIENLYWESLAHNCLKDCEKSQNLRFQAMQISEMATPDIIILWLHYQEGRSFERQIKENVVDIENARSCYNRVLKKMTTLPGTNSEAELRYRVYIRLAMIELGCFFGENKITCLDLAHLDENSLHRAHELLQAAESSKCRGLPMSKFCRAEYMLAKSVESYRCWQTFDNDDSYLDCATDEIDNAHKICVTKNFKELSNFVNSHKRLLIDAGKLRLSA